MEDRGDVPFDEFPRFMVLDNLTGEEADTQEIARNEPWAEGLMWMDMEGFCLGGDNTLYLLDECGKWRYCPEGRFKIVWEVKDV